MKMNCYPGSMCFKASLQVEGPGWLEIWGYLIQLWRLSLQNLSKKPKCSDHSTVKCLHVEYRDILAEIACPGLALRLLKVP